MENHTKEFRIGDYLGVFEKSLNYMAGTIFAAFIAGVSWYVSEPDRRTTFPQMLHRLHEDTKKLLCLVTALLSVLPYYFYYTLKDSMNWNTYGKSGDHKGLAKVGILYEICIMSIFYSLHQGDTRFLAAKLIAAFMNMVLIVLYSILLVKGKEKGGRLSYFLIVIMAGFFFFAILFVNSLTMRSIFKVGIPEA